MSAEHTTNLLRSPRVRRNRRPGLSISFTALAGAAGLGLLLAAGSASDVTELSEAMGVPIETAALPALG